MGESNKKTVPSLKCWLSKTYHTTQKINIKENIDELEEALTFHNLWNSFKDLIKNRYKIY